jgi:hypothetical protein
MKKESIKNPVNASNNFELIDRHVIKAELPDLEKIINSKPDDFIGKATLQKYLKNINTKLKSKDPKSDLELAFKLMDISREFKTLKLFAESGLTYDQAMVLAPDSNQIEIFLEFSSSFSDEQYWAALGDAYVLQDYIQINFNLFKTLFKADRPCKEYLMTIEERDYLAKLPSDIIIYRGCSIKEIENSQLGISWTLDYNVANTFAKMKYLKNNIETRIIEKVIKKDQAVAYFDRRNEHEIIYIPG